MLKSYSVAEYKPNSCLKISNPEKMPVKQLISKQENHRNNFLQRIA